jgi:peptidoglycan-associated lipoprotein
MTSSKWTIVALAISMTFACSRQAPPRQMYTATPPPPVALPRGQSAADGLVHISEDIRRACGISDTDAHFPFDSAELDQLERPVLAQLAKCFVSGALKGHQMKLVGHTDPRGDTDYNMVLGGSRADTVKTFLMIKGVSGPRIATTSRGELDATGTEETSWASDRRVDVLAE